MNNQCINKERNTKISNNHNTTTDDSFNEVNFSGCTNSSFNFETNSFIFDCNNETNSAAAL